MQLMRLIKHCASLFAHKLLRFYKLENKLISIWSDSMPQILYIKY